jgi:hypothetical protein
MDVTDNSESIMEEEINILQSQILAVSYKENGINNLE